MIVDRLANLELYRGLQPRWIKALEFLRDSDLATLPLGRHDLDGDQLFALVQEYTTRDESQCRWEAHERYCDVQYLVTGEERIGVANIDDLRVTEPYDAAKDVAFFEGDGDAITLRAGTFAIFAPQDVHKPCVHRGSPAAVRKVVIKSAV
ncbi:MAG: YhcH/YjgK/YiaL family protein [Pirellulaceae bacterium]